MHSYLLCTDILVLLSNWFGTICLISTRSPTQLLLGIILCYELWTSVKTVIIYFPNSITMVTNVELLQRCCVCDFLAMTSYKQPPSSNGGNICYGRWPIWSSWVYQSVLCKIQVNCSSCFCVFHERQTDTTSFLL